MAREHVSGRAPATCPRTCTRTRSRRTPTGRGCSPPGSEIWDYLRRCVAEFDLRAASALRARGHRGGWDDEARRWAVADERRLVHRRRRRGGARPAARAGDPRRPRASRTSRARCSTRRAGITTTTCAASASPSSAPGPRRSSSSPRSSRTSRSCTLFQRTAPWVVPRLDRPISRRVRRLYRRVPQIQAAMRGWIYATRESVVVGFMHPRLMALPQLVATSTSSARSPTRSCARS